MFRKTLIGVFVIVSVTLAVSAQQRFVAAFSGEQVVPANTSTGTGICRATLNTVNNGLSLTCEYSGLTSPVTALAVHVGAGAGQNIEPSAQVTVPGGTSGAFSVSLFGAATPAQVLSNRVYLTLRSTAFPNGEIRGQIHLTNSTYNDYDGDGRTDLVVYRNSNNTFFAQTSAAQQFLVRPLGSPGDSVSLTVDFDGDGRSDFSTARYNAEVLWRIFSSRTNSLTETRWGSSTLGDFFASADYDGDGAFDIAVFRAGVWYIIESSTGNFRYEFFGQSGDIPAPNDFDRDGKADLAVARSVSGQRLWFVRQSSDGAFSETQWGLSNDGFFTGRSDWDGDGAQDLTVIRNESGQRVFYIRRSSDLQLEVIRWGLSSDVVKLGDYDGDGRTDAAVTRAINGQRVFFIRQSSNGEPRYETIGLQGDF